MGKFTIDTDDPASEATWQAYKQAQFDVRDQVGVAYRGVKAALTMYGALAVRLTEGDLAAVADYHSAISTGLLQSEAALIGHLQAAIALIDEIQATRPGVFPGVPVTTDKELTTPLADFAIL